jgi:pilus assembly protein Flp/PilA
METITLAHRTIASIRGFARIAKDRRGVAALEYGLLAALVAAAVVVGIGSFSGSLESAFTDLGSKLTEKVGEIK